MWFLSADFIYDLASFPRYRLALLMVYPLAYFLKKDLLRISSSIRTEKLKRDASFSCFVTIRTRRYRQTTTRHRQTTYYGNSRTLQCCRNVRLITGSVLYNNVLRSVGLYTTLAMWTQALLLTPMFTGRDHRWRFLTPCSRSVITACVYKEELYPLDLHTWHVYTYSTQLNSTSFNGRRW